MKKNVMILCGVLVATLALANGPFEQAMAKGIPAMFTAEDATSLQAAINQLQRIGEAETDRWEPHYYAAFGYLRMSTMVNSPAEKDKFLDLGLETLEKGDQISPEDSEMITLRGYLQMIKLTVDPASRGATYSPLVFGAFQKAIALNPENPRAHFLLGNMQHGTAQFMGGGSEEACANFDRALALFEKESTASPVSPSWGKESALASKRQICDQGQ